VIHRAILALALALLSLAPALAAPASDPASAVPVPAGLAVPAVPSEAARIIVADTLRFPWPPVDSAAARDTSKKAVFIDTPPSKAVNADTTAVADTVASDAPAPEIPPPAPRPPAPPPRPRTRQELGKMSREDLFRLAFGRSAPDRPRNLAVRLFGEGRPAGNTELAYNDNFTAFTFYSMPFSRLLDRLILPEARAAAGDSMGRFRSETLEAAGYKLRVDDAKFELHVAFPPESKAVQFTSVYGGYSAAEPRGEELPPADVSFYANYTIDDRARGLRYDYRQSGSRDTVMFTRDPSTANFDGALNLRGWVFESSGWVREPYGGEPFTWEHARRGDARVVRNFLKQRSQLSIGDITAGTSILPGPIAGGVRYERNSYFFGNNPHDNLNSVSFFMPEPGEVEVYMDGAFRRRLYLPAGHHQVGGFGGEVGRNRVRLLLRMASGATEEVPFEFVLSAPRIMPRGDTRYALIAGVRREYAPSPACFSYDAYEPVAGADYAYGIHHAINAGLSAVATRRAGQAGAQASFGAGELGFVDVRAIASYLTEERLAGGRAEASYTADLERPVARFNRFITGDPGKNFLPPLSFALRGYYQTDFYSVRMFDEPFIGANGSVGGVSGNFAVSVWRGSLSAFGGANFYREAPGVIDFYPADYNYGARLSMGFGRSYFSAGAGESVRGGARSPYFALNSSHAFGADFRVKSHQFSASVNAGMSSNYVYADEADGAAAEKDSMEFDWTYGGTLGWRWSNNATGASAQSYSANVRYVNDQSPTASATLRHTYNRARLNANYDLAFSDYDAYYRQNHSVRGQLTGSLMFADGLWALGQQMSSGGGFALVDTRGDLKSAKVHINRSRATGNELSRSGWLGAAYHNRLTAYSPTELTLSLTDVPIGAVMEQSRYYAVGGYKQGFALKVGRRSQVIALVPFIEKRGGRPLAHAYLTIEPEREGAGEGESAAPRAAFTGGDGVLQTGGLTPGYSYRIRFRASARLKDALIHIPDGAAGIYEHPEVEVEAEE
jgi:hypothetical protein